MERLDLALEFFDYRTAERSSLGQRRKTSRSPKKEEDVKGRQDEGDIQELLAILQFLRDRWHGAASLDCHWVHHSSSAECLIIQSPYHC